eukprot:m.142100 g.142100  ORF g.142100 m.142100 type:complete len:385 (+) comp9640_c0_seq5:33-1187(+)
MAALARTSSASTLTAMEMDSLHHHGILDFDASDQENMNLDMFLLQRENSMDVNESKAMLLRPAPSSAVASLAPGKRAAEAAKDSAAVPNTELDADDNMEGSFEEDDGNTDTSSPAPLLDTPTRTATIRAVSPAESKQQSPGVVPSTTPVPAKRSLRVAPRRKALDIDERALEEEDESDDEFEMAATGVDRAAQLAKLQRLLNDRLADLSNISKICKGLTPNDRKKIRNRKASCVSRLKKKVALYELHNKLDLQARAIADLQAVVEARGELLTRHNIPFPAFEMPTLSTPLAPPSCPTPPVTPAPEPAKRPRGRPSKKAKLAEAAAAVAQEAARLQRAESFADGVCLCRDPPTDDMVDCTRCHLPYHRVCVGAPDPAKFICFNCC